MKMYVYPLLIIIAASSYGVVSTIIKLAMRSGFSVSEAVTSQFFIGFCIAVCIFFLTNRSKLSFKGVEILIFAGVLTGLTNILHGRSLNFLPASMAVVLLFQFTWIGMLISCITKRRFPNRSETVTTLQIVGIVTIILGMSLPTMLDRKRLVIKNKTSKQNAKNQSNMFVELKKHI
ncbi:hypothetical protein [Neobacillus drentensis]|uniref:EamA family transporter n=1 Tax=Neobacillus drentensis TaxID=220684 RepID=UPI000B329FCE|nr:hypothetical protein [Neobacillus drentensis]